MPPLLALLPLAPNAGGGGGDRGAEALLGEAAVRGVARGLRAGRFAVEQREGACRLELRSPDPSANPYLAFAVMLAAGLAGIEEELELQEPNEDQDLFMLSRQDLRQQGIATLPESLGEAVELFAESELMRATLGDHIHSYLVAAKRAEWNDYQGYVSQWERDRYLAVL